MRGWGWHKGGQARYTKGQDWSIEEPARHAKKQATIKHAQGQATVEFALVLFAFLGLVAGLGALAHFGQEGQLAQHAYTGASHFVGGGEAGAWADVFAY